MRLLRIVTTLSTLRSFNQDTGYTFEDADASSRVTIDLTLTQEDFDSATSVGPDVVKMTDANLDPMLMEGEASTGKNRFGTNKRH